jgi:hypothetical protein
MIYQDLAPFNNLDVARNIFVGREPVHGPFKLLDKENNVCKGRRVDPRNARGYQIAKDERGSDVWRSTSDGCLRPRHRF